MDCAGLAGFARSGADVSGLSQNALDEVADLRSGGDQPAGKLGTTLEQIGMRRKPRGTGEIAQQPEASETAHYGKLF